MYASILFLLRRLGADDETAVDDRTEHNRLILERFTHLALRVKLDSNKALDVDGQPVALPQAPNQHPFQGVSEDPNDVPVTVETVKAEVGPTLSE